MITVMRMVKKTKITLLPLAIISLLILPLVVEKPIPVSYALEVEDGGITIETPLPPYAFLYHGSNLTIEISADNPSYPGYGEGLSGDALYKFGGVMLVENNVTQTQADVICVIITSQMQGLKFYYSNQTPSESISFSLNAYENVTIGVQMNTTGMALGNYTGTFKIQVYEGACG